MEKWRGELSCWRLSNVRAGREISVSVIFHWKKLIHRNQNLSWKLISVQEITQLQKQMKMTDAVAQE